MLALQETLDSTQKKPTANSSLSKVSWYKIDDDDDNDGNSSADGDKTLDLSGSRFIF